MQNVRDPYEILQVHAKAVPEVIEAAYRTLARLHHPDLTDDPEADSVMADLNWAYTVLREPSLRASYDKGTVPIAVEEEAPAAVEPEPVSTTLSERVAHATESAIERDTANPGNTTLDFGRFAGMTLRQIARTDPSYLEWLRRHSSGIRYRHQIDQVLARMAEARAGAE
ncbi:MAG TPA: DnaJ domain-containing protein [Candidatus Limnocylindria bacterium]|nr:DnaJ domain-containing protein [Candidatus Limnocylindria bacterium]